MSKVSNSFDILTSLLLLNLISLLLSIVKEFQKLMYNVTVEGIDVKPGWNGKKNVLSPASTAVRVKGILIRSH
jgi:hypothetical protein